MITATLTRVHEQRIGLAVAVARAGKNVTITVDGHWDQAYLVWWDFLRHVIATGSRKGMEALLVEAQAEFDRQLAACALAASEDLGISDRKESGVRKG
jgi:hypothetical protein